MDPQISERLTDLCERLRKVEERGNQNKQSLGNLAKVHSKTNSEQAGAKSAQKQQKIKTLYRNAIASHEMEAKLLREALEMVVDVRQSLWQYHRRRLITTANQNQPAGGGVPRRGALMKILQQSASALPLFVPNKPGEPAPPLCGCTIADQSYVAKPGDMVAAFVPSPDGDGSKVWVLGEVLQYILGAGKYEIDDIDEEQKERHSIGRRRVIPLPTMRANPLTNPEALFARDALVLALYPQTTCFYRAIIDRPPEDPSQDYMVSFEDSTYTEGYSPALAVPQRYVIASREPKK